ncbi:BrnA antitoxin family protein [uncultured Azohydromonas sp.]|jgi:Uncharacterized protein conserved in bacteria|uniref:BrnA antitoxin family protein n=1 Tax=uncultured Azohydromonas sp. TaxID=487342 RepID=UPI0026098049|nr:BrnA antitoxin family protein [uncultured Azohydromonas sp.]
MSGSQKKPSERQAILEALKSPPPEGYYVWDGVDEDERPATAEELQAALAAARRRRGRPAGSTKTQIALRVDDDVLEAFKASGPGWQTRMNEALRDWLKSHPGGASGGR